MHLRPSRSQLALLLRAQQWPDLATAAQDLLQHFPASSFMLRMSVAGQRQAIGSLPPHIMAEFGDEADPVSRHIGASGIPLEWDTATLCASGEAAPVYQSLQGAGIVSGLSMAARSDLGWSRIDFYFHQDADKGATADLFLLGSYLHEAACRVWRASWPAEVPRLTTRERQCLQWSASGKTSQEIGQILGISQHTVYFHLKKVASKFKVYGTRHAISRAMDLKLIKPI
ncbi:MULTISPECIES: LuxR C-terminal-related transcriptional regulator [unclassified Massilia]|uniref:helix-turn-helix transcriptional regulator n=1 Tax=unclassified Massilia TaxID=2609279 RepID=UPI00067B2727|nr:MULTISPECIES: LuxR C-terminal-related transcriptional regulator [unclassified Massilia]